MIPRAAVVNEARLWLGTRWQHQGRIRGVGVDCIGLIGGVALAVGVPQAPAWAADESCAGYGRKPDPAMLLLACQKYLLPVPRHEPPALADILVMSFADEPQHFALVSQTPDYIIHAYAKSRRVVEHRMDAEWRGRVVMVMRFPEVG